MDLQKIKRLLLVFICLIGPQTVLAATDATRLAETQKTSPAPTGTTETRLKNNTVRGNTMADVSATTTTTPSATAAPAPAQTRGAAAMTTTAQPTTVANVTSADYMNNKSSTTGGGAGGGAGGGGGDGGGGAAGIATTASMLSTGNQTARSTMSPTVSSIICYNCSGDNCKNFSSDNSSSTCVSNTGICYIQYDTTANAMTLSCKPLYSSSGTCLSDNDWQAAKTNCETCCKTTSRCNGGLKTSTVEQKCLALLRSSASRCVGLSAALLVLIAAIPLPSSL